MQSPNELDKICIMSERRAKVAIPMGNRIVWMSAREPMGKMAVGLNMEIARQAKACSKVAGSHEQVLEGFCLNGGMAYCLRHLQCWSWPLWRGTSLSLADMHVLGTMSMCRMQLDLKCT